MEIVEAINTYGIMIVISALFLYDHYTLAKDTKKLQETNAKILEQNTKAIDEIKNCNENISKSLEIIQTNQERGYSKDLDIEKKIDCIKEKADIVKKEGK